MSLKFQTTYGETSTVVFAQTLRHEFPSAEKANHFADVFTNIAPSGLGESARFGWALGYIDARELADSASPEDLIDRVRLAVPVKDGWEWRKEGKTESGIPRVSLFRGIDIVGDVTARRFVPVCRHIANDQVFRGCYGSHLIGRNWVPVRDAQSPIEAARAIAHNRGASA